MAQGDYGKMSMWIDENKLVQITSIEKVTDAGNIAVYILNEGLGGFTDGSGSVNVNIGYVVPRTGFEFEFDRAVEEKTYHNVQISISGKSAIVTGKFMTNNISQSTDASVAGTTSFMGDLQALK